jgi:DNA invertase Pin-like site-specific DNA recombinase
MDELLAEIFDKLGGATAIARGTGCPVQTVHDWLAKKGAKPEIPPWRRAAVLDFARREKSFRMTPART